MLPKRLSFLVILCALVLLSGCTWFENLFFSSQESWVTIENRTMLQNGKGLHIIIKDGVIWELGNEALEVGRQIQKSFKLVIDDVSIPESHFFYLNGLEFPRDVYANNGQRLGSHYDRTDLYVSQLNLSEGPHKAYIEVKSLSSVIYTYSWQFTNNSR